MPSENCPSLDACVDKSKVNSLLAAITKANISDAERSFLRAAATRHYKFNYSLIADYYAHASAEMQRLMEDPALVLIDFNDAIAKGYVKLSKNIYDIMMHEDSNND